MCYTSYWHTKARTHKSHMRNCVYCFLSTRCFTIFTYCFCLSFKLITQPDKSIISFICDFKVVCMVIWFETPPTILLDSNFHQMSHPVSLWLAKKLCKTVWQRFTTLCIYRFRARVHYKDVRMTLFRKFCQGSMANREKTLIEWQLSKGTAIAQKAGKRWYLPVRSALWRKC